MLEKIAFHIVGGYISFLVLMTRILLDSSERLNEKHCEWEDRLYPN